MIVRLLEQPRAIQLEIVAPLGMPELPRVPEILAELGVQARSTVDHATRSHSVLRTRLVEANGETFKHAGQFTITEGDGILYVIDQTTCVECEGHHDSPKCVSVCPVDCIVKA